LHFLRNSDLAPATRLKKVSRSRTSTGLW